MPIPRVSSLRPDVPPEVDEIVDRALERRVDQRYQSASELLRDLGRELRPERHAQHGDNDCAAARCTGGHQEAGDQQHRDAHQHHHQAMPAVPTVGSGAVGVVVGRCWVDGQRVSAFRVRRVGRPPRRVGAGPVARIMVSLAMPGRGPRRGRAGRTGDATLLPHVLEFLNHEAPRMRAAAISTASPTAQDGKESAEQLAARVQARRLTSPASRRNSRRLAGLAGGPSLEARERPEAGGRQRDVVTR